MQLQGSKPRLPYEVLERAYAQEQLRNARIERAHRDLQAKLERSQAIERKASRICTKGAARAKEVSGRARLLEAKLDRLTSETDVDLLQLSVEEKEQRLHYNLQEAEDYKQKMLDTLVCFHTAEPPQAPATTSFYCEYLRADLLLLVYISHWHTSPGQNKESLQPCCSAV